MIYAILIAVLAVSLFFIVEKLIWPKPVWDKLYGYCKECGNPLYVPSKGWHTPTPPPVKATCFGNKPTNGNITDVSMFTGHEGLPILAGDEIGSPLNHPVNRGRFNKKQEKDIIDRYSFNFKPL